MRTIRKLLLLLLAASLLMTVLTAAVGGEVSLSLEGEDISSLDKPAFLDESSGSVMAPAELFSEVLGISAEYDAGLGKLTLIHEDKVMVFTLNEASAVFNGQKQELSAAPLLRFGTPYVPLRFTAEHFGYVLVWDTAEQRVDIRQADQFELGINRTQMILRHGSPSGTRASEKGYEWQVYPGDYTDFCMIGLDENQVTAYYVNSASWKFPFGIQSGMKLSSCNTIMSSLGYQAASGTGYTTYTSPENTLIIYFDTTGDNQAYAALYEDADYLTECSITPAVLSSMEDTLFDLSNVMRVRAGLDALEHDEKINSVAKAHAGDMAQNNYFSHLDTDGLDKTGRMKAAGYSDCYVSEALSMAYSDSFSVFASLYGNAAYRDILFAAFDAIGVGYSYNPDSEGVVYGVQMFYAEKL